jgi:hypothetical protein
MLELVRTNKTNPQTTERDLILICERLETANQELHAYFATQAGTGTIPEQNQIQWEELAFRASAMPAETLAGVRARVRALGREFVADILRSAEQTDHAERIMIEALIGDLTAGD